uniref:NADH-ubiquinone oxidoreductase chain 2 n=1 Tax=Ophiomusa kimblae TaxID=3135533 RepID=A0AAU6PWV7_9ECHI
MIITWFYLIVLLGSLCGVVVASHWVVIWIMIEINTLSMIPLLSSRAVPRSIEATSKYFIFQAVASVILLLGIFVNFISTSSFFLLGPYNGFSLIIIVLALGIKLGVFPSHYWFVDVMSGLSFSECFYSAVLSKLVPFYLLLVIVSSELSILYIGMGVGSIVLGSFVGLKQNQLRKLLALSSVAHMGWLLIVLPQTNFVVTGGLFVAYIVMVSPIFGLCNSFSLSSLAQHSAVNRSNISLLVLMVLFLSLAGFPPLLGFFYKWVIFYVNVSGGYFFIGGFLVIMSLVSIFFYIGVCYNTFCIYWPSSKLIVDLRVQLPLITSVYIVVAGVIVSTVLLFIGPVSGWMNL